MERIFSFWPRVTLHSFCTNISFFFLIWGEVQRALPSWAFFFGCIFHWVGNRTEVHWILSSMLSGAIPHRFSNRVFYSLVLLLYLYNIRYTMEAKHYYFISLTNVSQWLATTRFGLHNGHLQVYVLQYLCNVQNIIWWRDLIHHISYHI
jgi:hypothetical protein